MNSNTVSPVPMTEQPMPWLLIGVRILHLVALLLLPVAVLMICVWMFFEMQAIHFVAPDPVINF